MFLQNFYFAYGVICGGKSNALDDTVTDYAKKIETEDAKAGIIDFIKKLRTYYPPYSQFLTAFKLVGYSQKVKSYKTPPRSMMYSISYEHLKTTGKPKTMNSVCKHLPLSTLGVITAKKAIVE